MMLLKEAIFMTIINVKNYGTCEVSKTSKYIDVVKHFLKDNYKSVLCVKANNNIEHLESFVEKDAEIEFLNIRNKDGWRVYIRTLTLIYIKAVRELFPNESVVIEHSLNRGLSTRLSSDIEVDEAVVIKIKDKMKKIISNDEPIERVYLDLQVANRYFEEEGLEDKVRLSKYRAQDMIHVSKLGDYYDKFYGYLAISTGYIDLFDLRAYRGGIILHFPDREHEYKIPPVENTDKLAQVFGESEAWAKIFGVGEDASLNEHIDNCTLANIIRDSEGLQEKKIAMIADQICEKPNRRIILIAGPSSSGKTTFAQRLSVQLQVNGKRPVAISVDDYFVNRENTPVDENGDYDFEALEAIDLEQFNKDLLELIQGKKVELPRFNFKEGRREYHGDYIQIDEDQIVIIEGIHGLNDRLTSAISHDQKFKIYISALTQLNVDRHNRIPTTDTRILRRMVRDFKYRGSDAERTFSLWASVRRGENKNIFPFQESADAIFNSALVYELGVLKKYAEPLLKSIDANSKYYSEARRLLKFLKYFKAIEDERVIPSTSIVKEFVGGSCFRRDEE
jgi:uridine kinase